MLKKRILTLALTIGMVSPMMAVAADLMIINNTTKDSTSIINDGLCSTKVLGNDGITRAKSKKIIKDSQIRLACLRNLEDCKAAVYMTNNCSGDIITTVRFSVKSGIKSVTQPKPGYAITYSAFLIQIDQIP